MTRDEHIQYVSDQWVPHIRNNAPLFGHHINIPDLHKKPAVICGAGYSLDTCLAYIRQVQEQVTICCVDAAVRPVLQSGIRPNYIISVDHRDHSRFFDGLDLTGIIGVMNIKSCPDTVSRFDDRIWLTTTELEKHFVPSDVNTRYCVQHVPGGTVASAAYAVMRILNAGTIFMCGVDLCMTGSQYYATGVTSENIVLARRIYIRIRDRQTGRMIPTTRWFLADHQWFLDYAVPPTYDCSSSGILSRGNSRIERIKPSQIYSRLALSSP